MNNILVVAPAWVGDMVMAQSLFKVLRRAQPHSTLTVLAPPWSMPLVCRMPEVEQRIDMPLGHGQLGLGARRRLGRGLRRRFRHAIVLPGSLKAALVPWFARIPRRTGYLGEQRWGLLNDIRHLDRSALPMNVQRFVALGLPKGAPPPTDFPHPALLTSGAAETAARHQLAVDAPILALCPGAEYGPAKRWPAAYFAEVAAAQLRRGWHVWLFGSQKDREFAEVIRARAPHSVDLCGRTTLGEATDLLSLARYAVTNDSGLLHVAAAVGCHVIALYGSSSDIFTPPLTSRRTHLALDLPCRPCFRRECPLGHLNCLRQLSPQRVIALLEK